MDASLTVLRLYSTASGASCFGSYAIPRELRDFAPPAAHLYASEKMASASYVLVRLPAGWVGERHRSPRRQILFCLSGQVRITPGVGGPRTLGVGGAWLMEDTEGDGHKTEVISDGPFDAVIIQLPESAH